jgi:hypothetical protein
MNRYEMREAETLNKDIQALPVANEIEFNVEGADKNNYKAVVVNGEVISVPKKSYNLVQHNEAFRPIIEGITQAGMKKFNYVLWSNNRKAELQLYLQDDVYDSVSVGITVKNSFDYSSAINFGFRMEKRTHILELVGYRQVCANGMKIRVPLNEAEIVRPEIRQQIENLFEKSTRLLHTKGVNVKLEQMQYYAEALALLKDPVRAIIQKAEKFDLRNKVLLKRIVDAHVGKRTAKKVLEQFKEEKQDLWGLYNAITYVASHNEGLNDFSRERLIDKAADMLQTTLVTA